jgi:hypothetical protein
MNPARRDIPIWRGNSETFSVHLKSSAGTDTNLNGETVNFVIESDDVFTTIPATITSALTGEFTVFISAAVTKDLTAKNHMPNYEIQRVKGAEIKTVMYGNLLVKGGVNHD